MKKNVLVLSTLDERGLGHGWSHYQEFTKLGFNTDFVCLLRTKPDTPKYIIDSVNPYNLKYFYFRVVKFLLQIIFKSNSEMRYWYKGWDFASADDVLKHLSFKPDYILIGSYQFFLSPKSIYNLWKKTHATIVILMVDEKLLSGGCPYPLDCEGYKSQCKNCPRYTYLKLLANRVFTQKEKYLSKVPLHISGTRYDLNKVNSIPYLNNKEKHAIVCEPKIPFYKSKIEARKELGLPLDDFIIFAGAVSVTNPFKGFAKLRESLLKFSKEISNRKVTFIFAGKNKFDLDLPHNISVVQPGFMDTNKLFTTYFACDIYTSPSLEDSGPMMVNYAIACGRPVIAFPVGVALDLVKHKETGWMAEKGNTDQYAEGLNYFYTLKETTMEMIQRNCRDLITHFGQHPWYEFMLDTE